MPHVGPLEKTLIFLSPLGSLNFLDFLSFLFILKLSYSKPSHSALNYASTANVEEVVKFYNPGDKTFETDFSLNSLSHILILVFLLFFLYFVLLLLKIRTKQYYFKRKYLFTKACLQCVLISCQFQIRKF